MKRASNNRGADKKVLLIEAARELIAQKGYREVTVADITETAGLGKGTFYLYFENKESLFQEVVKDEVLHLRTTLGRELRDIDDPYERVRAAVPVIFRLCRMNAGLYLAIFQETLRFEEGDPEGYGYYFLPMVDDFRRVIEEGIGRGEFHVRNPEIVAFGMIGLMESLVRQWLLIEKGREIPNGYLEEMSDTVAGFCLHGLVGKPIPDMGELDDQFASFYRRQLREVRLRLEELSRLEAILVSRLHGKPESG